MRIVTLLSLILCLMSCKSETPSKEQQIDKPMSVAEKIAQAHGYDHWQDVSEIQFTFNVDRDTTHFERHWVWKPKSHDITMMTATDTITYNRRTMDSTVMRTDGGFINDKFWMLVPFQLVWDEGISISEPTKENAPISGEELHKITLLYSGEGGYTPGDAYDIYYDDDYMIREWIFRKGNQQDPSLTNTFENYIDVQGIKIATEHKRNDADWNLNFSNITIKKD